MNKLYYILPKPMQHILTSIYGLKLRKRRYNQKYREYLISYSKETTGTKDDRLISFLLHLKNNIEYYRDIEIDEENPIDTFLNLEYTTKENLRTELNLRSDIQKVNNVSNTGGTTGKSLKVYSNPDDSVKRMAYLDYIKLLYGVLPFSKRASFTGKEITNYEDLKDLWRYNYFMNQVLYASFKINNSNVRYIYEKMRKHKPTSIDGFPSSIHQVAKYILDNDIQIDWRVDAVFPTAETLHDFMRKDIEVAFKTKVIDQYASSEGAPFLYSTDGMEYKIGHETGIFEFHKVEGKKYEMIVTSFINSATPIVRYKIKDYVEIDSKSDYLNSFSDEFVILKILGRDNDYLIGEDGNQVSSANMSNVIKDAGDKIIQTQFIQDNKESLIVNIIVSDEFDDDNENLFKSKIRQRLGNKVEIQINYTKEIDKEKSGKTRFILNRMVDSQ